MDFTGKVVVITGAGKGIGKVIARKYAEKQAIVFIIDINSEAGEENKN